MLLVDIGNARVKWASCRRGALFDHGETAYTPETLADRMDESRPGAARPDRVVACNVGGAAAGRAMAGWVRRAWSIETEFTASAAEALGVTSAYENPSQLGVDRWMALIAAHHKYRGSVLILDCGTAVTLDVLARGGRHLGGLIVPGLGLMRRSLLERTDGIGEAHGVAPSLLARTTGDAVAAGTLAAVVSLVDRVVAELGRELGEEPECVITGGELGSLAPHVRKPCRVEPDLVLQGVAAVAAVSPDVSRGRPRLDGTRG